MTDYYATLGIEKSATRDDIKKAYKKLAKKYHPDLNKDNPDAEKKFKEVSEAAAVLGDEEKRRQYDSMGHDAFTQGARGGGGFDYSGFSGNMDFGDIFESFFGGGFGDIFGGRRSSSQRGADLRYDLTISLHNAAFGVKRQISLRKKSPCSTCNATGGSRIETCSTCHGHGAVKQARRTPFGVFQTTSACPKCNGEGQEILEPCGKCSGSGAVVEKKELEVEIPAGVESGTRLRMSGEGEAGVRGARSGDLYIFLTVEEHELFERHGADIHLETPISFFQAVFGATIEVPTLEGKAKVKIPAGTQSGTVFRLRGKGMPFLHARGHGDQLVTAQVETPKKVTKKQEKLMKELQTSFGEKAAPEKSLFKKLKEHLS